MSIITKLNSIAIKLLPFSRIFIVLALAALAFLLFAFFYFPPEQNKQYTMPALIGFLWAIMASIFVHLLSSLPKITNEKLSFFQRIKSRIVHLLYYIVFTLFILLTIASVLASIRFLAVLGG